MCCNLGNSQTQTDRRIAKEIQKASKRFDETINILLLGPGESGKSTIAKQMKVIHLSGYDDTERATWTTAIFKNILFPLRTLIEKCYQFELQLSSENQTNAAIISNKENAIFGDSSKIVLNQQNVRYMVSVWSDPAIKEAYKRRNQYQLNDSTGYFLDSLERICEPLYTPTTQDILMARIRTTGIHEIQFGIEGTFWNMIDVGGQRTERRKWVHCFENVTTILFCTSLSEFNQQLAEDETVNRMEESISLFRDVVNSPWFAKVSFILFLNKKDLFEEKIENFSIRKVFPDFLGNDCSFEETTTFIKEKFLEKKLDQEKKVFSHITCATSTENIVVIFTQVKTMVLETILSSVLSV